MTAPWPRTGAPQISWNGAELDHYLIGIGSTEGCSPITEVARDRTSMQFFGQQNDTTVRVCIQPVSAAGKGVLGGNNATPHAGQALPPGGDLCGVLPVGTTTVRAGSHIICPLGLAVPTGASLVFDASAGPITVRASFGIGIAARGGDVSTIGTGPSRTVSLGSRTGQQWFGLSVGGSIDPSAVAASSSVVDLSDFSITTAGLNVQSSTSLSLHRFSVSGEDDNDAYPGGLRGGFSMLMSVNTPTVVDHISAHDSEIGGVYASCACPLRMSNISVDNVHQQGVSVSRTDDLVLHHVQVAHSGQTGPVPAVALSGVTTSVGPGDAVDDIQGFDNAEDAMFLEGTITRSLTWRPVTELSSTGPLGYVAGLVTMTHDVVMTVPAGATVVSQELTFRDGARLDASHGGLFTGMTDPRLSPRLCGGAPGFCTNNVHALMWQGLYFAESASSGVLDGVTLRNVDIAVRVATEDFRSGTVEVRDSTVTDCSYFVTDSVRTSATSRVILDHDTVSGCAVGVAGGGAVLRVTRSSFTGNGSGSVGIKDYSGQSSNGGQSHFEADTITGFPYGVAVVGSERPVLRCLDITGNTTAGLFTADVPGDPTTLTSSNDRRQWHRARADHPPRDSSRSQRQRLSRRCRRWRQTR